MEHCKKLTPRNIYGVRKFPYRGKRKYVPGVNRSFYGTITITNDVFGMTIYQFEREFKACLKRRKEHEQQIMNIRFPDKTGNWYFDYLKYGDETVQDQTLSEQYRNYHKLIQAAGTELEIRTRQKMFIINDQIQHKTRSKNLQIKISSGSFAEGIHLPGSDFDIMYDLTEIKVIPDLKYLYTCLSMGETTLLMENDERYPGFCKLKLVFEGYSVSKYLRGCFKDDHNGVYLSTEDFVSNCGNMYGFRHQYFRHGPCLSDADQTLDIAHCVRSKVWPPIAMNWIYRHRSGQWPTENLIDIVAKDGCLIVPIGPKNYDNELFWRISFSLAEKRLIHSMNYTQFLCYVLMKLVLKHIINRNEEVKDMLCSYFLKTTLFWLSEEISIDTFKFTNLPYCFSLCIDKLMSFVRDCYCPNYFIPQHNMFIGKVDESNNKPLLSILTELKKSQFKLILDQIPENNLKYHNMSTTTDRNKLSLNLDKLFIRAVADIYLPEDFERGCKVLQYINKLMESESSEFITDILRFYYAEINQQMSQMLALACCYRSHCRIPKIRCCRKLLMDGTKSDAVSGWLLFASFYYVLGQYKTTLQIVDNVLSRCTPDMFPFDKALRTTKEWNDYKVKTKNHLSFYERMKQDILDNVRFSVNSTLIPDELRLEVQGGHIMVPPVVMCYCLQFLCYHHLSHVSNRNRSLHQLYQATTKAYLLSERLIPTALVILGVCNEIAGDKDTSKACYREAMCPNHSHRDICRSAKQRLQNLLNT